MLINEIIFELGTDNIQQKPLSHREAAAVVVTRRPFERHRMLRLRHQVLAALALIGGCSYAQILIASAEGSDLGPHLICVLTRVLPYGTRIMAAGW